MLVWVASYPRSGNSLALLTLQNVFGVGAIGAISPEDLALGRLVGQLLPGSAEWEPPEELRRLSGTELLDALRERPEPYFVKTHRLREAPDPASALYIVRDGRDAIISQAHFVKTREVQPFADLPYPRRVARLICPGVLNYGHWSHNVSEWRERDAPTALLRFEELIADPAGVIGAACEEIGVSLRANGASIPFEQLHERVPAFFRKGKVGGWRKEMPKRLQERFWRIHGEQMHALGYER